MKQFLGEGTQTPASGILDTIGDPAITQHSELMFLICFDLVLNETLSFN